MKAISSLQFMRQLTQILKDGSMAIREVPLPALQPGWILVRNHFSAISAGTEGKTVKDARLGYIRKAQARQAEVKKVLQAIRTYGLRSTYQMVMNRLETPVPLGYSSAGEVIEVASDVLEFKTGDRVACGGATSCHAEVIAVPVNLAVKLPDSISMDEAAFITIGSIALQGIRQASLQLGETCVVIGLGLIGQITMQLLRASGIYPLGIDIRTDAVEQCNRLMPHTALLRTDESLVNKVLQYTSGFGCDAVIITASSSSDDPINLAGELCRQKGRVIVVGAVNTGFDRKNYYRKELDLRMSCSYGPGRYDDDYELRGIDYPVGYVRWTENRNMQAFARLLAEKSIDLKSLITHRIKFENAPQAYQMILEGKEKYMGIVLEYDVKRKVKHVISMAEHRGAPSPVKAGVIGAGSFAQNFLLPALKGMVSFKSVVTARPNHAYHIATRYGFARACPQASDVWNDPELNTVFIVTRHNTHAPYVLSSLSAGKHVYVEKPLCLNEQELEQIRQQYSQSPGLLLVGFNRRFAPMIEKVKSSLSRKQPLALLYRINANKVEPDHWIHDPEIGGGRIIGEVCHFIDLCCYLAGSSIRSLSACALNDPYHLHDTVTINLQFNNHSIASISYFSTGNDELGKEYLEVYGDGKVAVLDDFRQLTLYGPKKKTIKGKQDKGHQMQIRQFVRAIEEGKPSPIPFEEIYHSMLATFKVIESIQLNGASVNVTVSK